MFFLKKKTIHSNWGAGQYIVLLSLSYVNKMIIANMNPQKFKSNKTKEEHYLQRALKIIRPNKF